MRVSINGGTPKSSTLIGFSLINHPFGGTPIYGNPHMIIIDPKTIFFFTRMNPWISVTGCGGGGDDGDGDGNAKGCWPQWCQGWPGPRGRRSK